MFIIARVIAFNISTAKGMPKNEIETVTFLADKGMENDAHLDEQGGLRQVSLLASESADKIRDKIPGIVNGRFAENITTEGIELFSLPIGTKLLFDNRVLMEVSQIGKTCHNGCAIKQLVGDCVMPREGIFCRVLEGGTLTVGCEFHIVE